MMRRVFTSLIAVSAFSALLTLTPPTAHAIPSPGTYDIEPESSNGLTGWFTVNSTATALTDWHFQFSNLTWDSSTSAVLYNLTTHFFVIEYSGSVYKGFEIYWPLNLFSTTPDVGYGAMTFSPRSVPEPPTAALLLPGLGLLVGYGIRQRRQSGLQVA